MAIIAFWSDEEKETGQTMSMVALSTYMAIKHNYRILEIDTSFHDETLENSYWNMAKEGNLIKGILQDQNKLSLESSIEGLVKVIKTNRIDPSLVSDYTRKKNKNKLDVLCAPKSRTYEDYKTLAGMYNSILQVANKSYDLIFIDISKMMPKEYAKQILEFADIIIVNINQRLRTINNFTKLRMEDDFFKKNNILINVGRYDQFSKYNIKNITRFMNEKDDIHAVPYNTLFFEACAESSVTELFWRFEGIDKIDPDDRNSFFIMEIERLSKDILYKMQELQLKA